VVREAGGDRSGVTGGTRVLSDAIVVEVTAEAGGSFLDRMIALVEGAVRQKTPNELALTVTLAGLTLAFVMVTVALWPIGRYFGLDRHRLATLMALLVCLIPTTIGGLLAAIGLAGMDRALSANVLAKSGKAVELAGDIDTLLLDKTGTITHGQPQGDGPASGRRHPPGAMVAAAMLASLATRRRRAARSWTSLKPKWLATFGSPCPPTPIVAFTAQTRLSGVDLPMAAGTPQGRAGFSAKMAFRSAGHAPRERRPRVDRPSPGAAAPPSWSRIRERAAPRPWASSP
jgi:K+-transporting ATPase ATPase B chain